MGDDAIAINDKCGSGGTHVFLAVHVLLHPYAVSLYNFVTVIGYQGKGQTVFRFKFLVRFFIVGAYAYHFKTFG